MVFLGGGAVSYERDTPVIDGRIDGQPLSPELPNPASEIWLGPSALEEWLQLPLPSEVGLFGTHKTVKAIYFGLGLVHFEY